MDDKESTLAVDIGGGKGEYYSRLAKKNPDKTYLVLDPAIEEITNRPDNLYLVKWRSDVESAIPLKSYSVDEVDINFLMGEIDTKEEDDSAVEDAANKYRRILVDLKPIMKKGAVIRITDAKELILPIADLLKQEGYTIFKQPSELKDKDRTLWSKAFSDFYFMAGRSKKTSHILPMAIQASWQGGHDN